MNSLKDFLHHLFIPKETNNFRARVLHHDFLSLYLVFALLLVFSVKGLNQVHDVLGYATDITTQKLLDFTNSERTKNHLGSLKMNDHLESAAKHKAQDMFAQNYWAHFAPDGKTPWSFMYQAGYQYEYAGENLAKNFMFSKNVVDAWMASPTHRENLLRPEYTEVGFAIVDGVLNGEQTTLVVQMFGKPLATGQTEAKDNLAKPVEAATGNLAGVSATKPLTNQTKIPINVFWVFAVFLIATLLADLYFAYKFNIVRYHGKNIAHIIFIIFISLGIIFFITKGAIL